MSSINRLPVLFLIISILTSPMALQAAEPVGNSKIQQDIKHLLQSENLSIRGVDGLIPADYKRDQRTLDALNGPVIIQPPDA